MATSSQTEVEMNALAQHYIRKAALEVKAHNPASTVFVPEEPDYAEVVAELARQMLISCTDLSRADRAVNDYEVILEQQGQIIARVAEAFNAVTTRSWDDKSRKDEMAALGADILRIVFSRFEAISIIELEREA